MVISRRQILKGLSAAPILVASASYGAINTGERIYSGARRGRQDLICGLGSDQTLQFEIPVPSRAHGFARHPQRPLAIGFARRPGMYAKVFHSETGELIDEITSTTDRHFYGHGVFSADGQYLFATENDFVSGRGVIGVYDVDANFRRIGEFSSGGIGPHEILRIPGTNTLVVANGGVRTHPDTGRTPLNLDSMASSLIYLDQGGEILEHHQLADWQQLSIRHLTVDTSGRIGMAMQYRGPEYHRPPLLATHIAGQDIIPLELPSQLLDRLNNYIGSIRFDYSGHNLIASAPRGGLFIATNWHGDSIGTLECTDGCGIHTLDHGMMFSSGQGELFEATASMTNSGPHQQFSDLRFDNHMS